MKPSLLARLNLAINALPAERAKAIIDAATSIDRQISERGDTYRCAIYMVTARIMDAVRKELPKSEQSDDLALLRCQINTFPEQIQKKINAASDGLLAVCTHFDGIEATAIILTAYRLLAVIDAEMQERARN